MKLYEINQLIEDAYESAIDPETGEIVNEEAYEALDALNMVFEEKMENLCLWYKNLVAEADAVRKEKAVFTTRLSRLTRKADLVERYIASVLAGRKFVTSRVKVSWRKSETAEYKGDVHKLPLDCQRISEPEVDKVNLKKRLKSGEEIKDACLVVKNNMSIK